MARSAALVLEAALVRIGVAVVALAERQALVTRGASSIRRVALLAFHLHMQASQRIARLGVIELAGSVFPVDKVVALDAIRSQPPFVKIFVTRRAGLRDSQEALAQIFRLDVGALGGRNPLRQVTLVAGQPRVLALQHVAGLAVIELVRTRVPLDQRKICAVVIRVTLHAFLAGARGNVIRAVQTLFCCHPRPDVGVATDALEYRLTAADLMTIRAVRQAIQKLVRSRQRAGRDLGVRVSCGQNTDGSADGQQQKRSPRPLPA